MQINFVVPILIAIVGWWIAITNLNRQHRRNIELDRNKFKRELQIKTADEAIKHLAITREKLGDVHLLLTLLPGDLKVKYTIDAAEISFKRWEKPNDQINDLWDSARKPAYNFLYFFESREVVLNEFILMKNEFLRKLSETERGLNKCTIRIAELYYSKYLNNIKLSDLETQELTDYCQSSGELIIDLLTYIYDFNVELQNAFLSETFDYKVQQREPNDLKYTVLKREINELNIKK
ncbi:hypothetical protein [Paenibacillus whitsoniae]|uniref:Uncharacterized protein n=1 Tax=Paenibacillus whitsoniae TaxID=2496558 RepID=A0A3S0A204_9BACL|nr:hypothetical protein [Paenibacillus whitsoniae]RTE07178.1 hypothetical protein EJQ19_21745 [Paenibacillus whitsoniae]